MKHIGFAAWQSCQQLQIVKLPLSVVSLEDGAFQGCYVLKEVVAPGCVQFSRRVFAECCSLSRVGISNDTEATNDLAPGAQLGPFAFESCLTLTTSNFVVDKTNKSRTLPDGSFCGAGIESLCLPCDFRNIGPKASRPSGTPPLHIVLPWLTYGYRQSCNELARKPSFVVHHFVNLLFPLSYNT